MASSTFYHPGGYDPAAPAHNLAQQVSNGTQPGDPPAGYTTWDTNGTVLVQRPLTAGESADLAARDTAATETANEATLRSRAQQAITNNTTYLGVTTPSNAQVVAQVAALTKQNAALIRLVIGQLDATT
jgi:hypothetical protein